MKHVAHRELTNPAKLFLTAVAQAFQTPISGRQSETELKLNKTKNSQSISNTPNAMNAKNTPSHGVFELKSTTKTNEQHALLNTTGQCIKKNLSVIKKKSYDQLDEDVRFLPFRQEFAEFFLSEQPQPIRVRLVHLHDRMQAHHSLWKSKRHINTVAAQATHLNSSHLRPRPGSLLPEPGMSSISHGCGIPGAEFLARNSWRRR